MGCRKKMWLRLSLWFTLVYTHCTDSRHVPESSANELSKQRESENVNYFNNLILTGLSNSETTRDLTKFNRPVHDTSEISKSRLGYEKDLMVVLPVMPKNVEDGSNLQMWYTQVPVTAIIEDHTQRDAQKRADYDVYENSNTEKRHPYTKFLVNKATSKPQRSPLDYGYPDSFKFVEDMNGLPSNHKPEWVNTDITDLDELPKSTTEHFPGNNPFEMFESVKPLEINKLLAPHSVLISSEVEDNLEKKNGTQSNIKTIPKRPVKRPTKKPQKIKSTTESNNDTISTTSNSVMGVDQLYSAARFTTLLESNKEFLPTLYPYKHKLSVPEETTSVSTTTEATTTTLRPTSLTTIYSTSSTTVKTTTTTESITTSTTTARPSSTTTTTTEVPSISEIVVYNVTEDTDNEEFQSPDNFTAFENTDFQVDNFEPLKNLNYSNLDIKESNLEPFKELNPTLSGDMLTNDMKDMLISLGILKSDGATTTIINKPTTEKIFVRKELVTPSIDPNSYTSFKKIPTDYKNQNEKSGISEDMKDLLASFGLLPKKPSENDNSVTRISRQQNLDVINSTKELTSEEVDLLDFFNDKNSSKKALEINSAMLSDEMKSTLENMGLLKELSRSPKSGHVFQPTSHLEKLTKEQNVKKINDVIKTIKSLSIKTESNDLSAEEIEKQLANITVTLNDENVTDTSDTLLFELNEVLTNDTKVKLIDSVENNTNKTNAIAPEISDYQPSTRINYFDTTIPNFSSTTVNESIESSSNPLSTEELLQLYEMGKNEIKRQQPNETQAISTTSSPETTLSSIEDIPGANTEVFPISLETPSNTTISSQPSSSTEINSSSEMVTDAKVAENNNAPIADLADSFGGGGVASEEPSTDDLPTPKPNGLYFYLDWNTFLNVGEEDKNPIRIRFAPRAGNPRNFLPITVP